MAIQPPKLLTAFAAAVAQKPVGVDNPLSNDVGRIRYTITQLLRDGIKLPTWTPQDTHPYQDHIANLRIPVLSMTPSLLFHGLGVSLHDMDMERHIHSIFSTEQRQT
jgi:hypothetical protein